MNEDWGEERIKVDFDGIAEDENKAVFIEEDGQIYLKFKSKSNTSDEAEEMM